MPIEVNNLNSQTSMFCFINGHFNVTYYDNYTDKLTKKRITAKLVYSLLISSLLIKPFS